MIEHILDLHIHSKYARACSKDLELATIAAACETKGITIVSTGDFTHPAWFRSMEETLEEIGTSGLLRLKSGASPTRFIIGTEISCIYKHREKTRRLHLLVFAPNLACAKEFNTRLVARGVNVKSDGRPIMGLSAKEIVNLCVSIDPRMMVVPAHAWTPWFAVFGSKSGYDSLEECFEELTPEIFAIETGLSSDPPMNHRISALDHLTLISNSDAHSLGNLGREANVFHFENEADITYEEIRRIIKSGDRKKFLYTIEFYPEEGMYHYDGHRDCGVSFSPEQTKKNKGICPVCKKSLTIGVLYRVDSLADRSETDWPKSFIPFRSIIPLRNIIAYVFDVGKASKKVATEYERLIARLGPEFSILLHRPVSEIKREASDPNIALAIANMRANNVRLVPGYDGVYGSADLLVGGRAMAPKQQELL